MAAWSTANGTTDYRKYFDLLNAKHYNGWMLIEITRQLQIQAGYNAFEADRKSYQYLSPLLRTAGLR